MPGPGYPAGPYFYHAPPRRPVLVGIALAAYVLNALVMGGAFLVTVTTTGTAVPLPMIVAAVVIGLVFVALAIGVWVGRGLPRWVLIRLGLGFGVVFGMGGIINVALSVGEGMTNSMLIGVLNLMSALLLVAGGLMLLADPVRDWCFAPPPLSASQKADRTDTGPPRRLGRMERRNGAVAQGRMMSRSGLFDVS